jgi:hypothetical protein
MKRSCYTEKAEEAPSECEVLLKEWTRRNNLVVMEGSYKGIVEDSS